MGDYTPPVYYPTPEKETASVTLTISGNVRVGESDRVAGSTDAATELSLESGS